MAIQTLGKALSVFGITPSVVEVFFVDYEEKVNKAKFADHLAKHGISYETEEEYNYRLSLYLSKDKEINEINAEQDDFRVDHNHLSTWTKEEIDQIKGHVHMPLEKVPQEQEELGDKDDEKESYPERVDWVTRGMVSAIQNQGQCGSCWAFSSIAAIESAYAIAGNKLTKLSEQQLVNCAENGCNGGNYPGAFKYAQEHKILSESQLPYTAEKGNCTEAL
jgi:cathepsin L